MYTCMYLFIRFAKANQRLIKSEKIRSRSAPYPLSEADRSPLYSEPLIGLDRSAPDPLAKFSQISNF